MGNIRLDTGAIPQPDPHRTGGAARNAPAGAAADAQAARPLEQALAPDTVELSADAQQVSSTESIPQGELPADRMREIGQRIASGHYSKPDVQAQIADKIKGELGIG